MRTISCKLEDLKTMTLHIGYEGENDYTSVRIDAGSVFAQYPEAVTSLKVQPPKGNMYPVIVTRDGDIVIWNVSDSDTASNGNGEIQLTFTENTVVVKSCTGKTLVHRSLKATGPAPDPLIDFIDRAEEVVGEAQDAAEAAEAAAQHAPMIGLDGYWYKWDAETEGYVKTDTKARGEDGANGVGITSVEKISTVGLVDTYRINFTNGTNTTYTVTNGQDGSVPIDDITPAANKVFSSAKVDEELTGVKNDIDGVNDTIEQVTEDYGHQTGWDDVQLANPLDVKVHYRCADTVGNQVSKTSSGTKGFNSSSVTTCIVHAFDCEADKKYRLIVTNGQSPASITERGTIVIAEDYDNTKYKVKERFRYTNTANVQDIFEFTPSYAGHVYFNLDANYQSISVKVEAEIGTGKTAVDEVARTGLDAVERFVFNSDITPELTFESGDFDYTLADGTGTGYRSQIIEGVKDCDICIKVNPTYTAMYGNGTDELVTVHGSFVYHSTRDNVRLWVSDTVANSGLEVRIYKEKGHRGIYDVIVAASDSAASDKAIADIVCDGSHDEIDLQFAVNWNVCRKNLNTKRDSCNVLLLPGNYTIDAFETKETLHGDDTVAQYAVMVGNDQFSGANGYCYSAAIHGTSDQGHLASGAVARINVSNAALSMLSESVENVLIGVCRAGARYGGGIHMNAICIEVKNLSIYTNGINNKIIALDGYTAGGSVFENNDIWSVSSTSGITPTAISQIPAGSIGIRAGDGSCYGVRQSIKGNRIQGFREGVAITGEHFVVQDNLELRCTYGFTTNMYEHNGANQHPNVFIGNSVEQCYIMGKLGTYTGKQTLVYIGGSVENMIDNEGGEPVAMLPIEVSNDSKYRGRIESDSLADPYDESMFESGKGTNFEQIIYPYNQA